MNTKSSLNTTYNFVGFCASVVKMKSRIANNYEENTADLIFGISLANTGIKFVKKNTQLNTSGLKP